MPKVFFSIALLTGLLMAHSSSASAPLPTEIPGVTSLTIEQVFEIAASDKRLAIVDTRIAADYERGHIEDAVNLTDTQMTAKNLAQVAAKDQQVLFYCNGGECRRSMNACIKAVQWGWTNVMWFPGGIAEWNANDLPLSR